MQLYNRWKLPGKYLTTHGFIEFQGAGDYGWFVEKAAAVREFFRQWSSQYVFVVRHETKPVKY
jgi:hypothetical protein